MMYVKADDESILPYGEEVQRRRKAFLPLDLSTVVLGIGIIVNVKYNLTFTIINYLKCLAHPQTKVCYSYD